MTPFIKRDYQVNISLFRRNRHCLVLTDQGQQNPPSPLERVHTKANMHTSINSVAISFASNTVH